ncbi:SDR family NAD(P)-dependent oxidoreductase [Nonomuraea sp. NPDC052116]|uniref:SDR family NAD(P)-dependent oxidoreductase n=1 Tax=Nonomuraea sp. NPDC052116 TaxID=3155665 RepID=UPI003417F853
MSAFDSKICLVTGAGSGIGRAMAVAFAKSGARVVVCDVNEESAHRTAADIGDEAAVTVLVETAIDAYGRIEAGIRGGAAGAAGGMGRTARGLPGGADPADRC